MTDSGLLHPSRSELAERRRQLRRQRRLKLIQRIWRTTAVAWLTAALVWVVNSSNTTLYSPSQIQIEGNRILATEAIQALLPIDYPQSLIDLKPQSLEAYITAHAPIAQVQVRRRLFPPALKIYLQEREPVAVVVNEHGESPPEAIALQSLAYLPTGLLDSQGVWIAQENLHFFEETALPRLTVRQMQRQHLAHWPQIYAAIQSSPVIILEIAWQIPDNMVLDTDLGKIHLGAYSDRFPQQLTALAKLRSLKQQLDPEDIAYIDIQNPSRPLVQMMQANQNGIDP